MNQRLTLSQIKKRQMYAATAWVYEAFVPNKKNWLNNNEVL